MRCTVCDDGSLWGVFCFLCLPQGRTGAITAPTPPAPAAAAAAAGVRCAGARGSDGDVLATCLTDVYFTSKNKKPTPWKSSLLETAIQPRCCSAHLGSRAHQRKALPMFWPFSQRNSLFLIIHARHGTPVSKLHGFVRHSIRGARHRQHALPRRHSNGLDVLEHPV